MSPLVFRLSPALAPLALAPLSLARLALALFALAPLAGCELAERTGIGVESPIDAGLLPSADADAPAEDGSVPPTVSYHRDIRPIIDAHCLGCHGSDGIGSLDLRHDSEDWLDGPAWWAAAAADAMLSGRMPPWMPVDDCRPIVPDRSLDDAARVMVDRWRMEGFPEGDARDRPPMPPVVDDERAADRVWLADGYVPDFGAGDDHRCRVVGESLGERLFVSAIGVAPDQRAMVRRARVFAVAPTQAEALAALDAGDAGSGYGCFGGPGLSAELLAAWQPGDGALVFPPTSAVVLEAGSRLVLQVQFSPAGLDSGGEVPVDRSAVTLWLRAADDAPSDRVRVVRHGVATVRVPAGEVANSASDFVIGQAATVIGVVPQMQAFGAEIEASIVRADGEDVCLVRIDEWQFDRQRSYVFPPEQWVAIGPDDLHRVRCVHDNRGGASEVGPGDGPGDEACVDHLVTTVPYVISGP